MEVQALRASGKTIEAQSNSVIYLTPSKFRKLDRIAREHARVPIEVVSSSALRGCFAGVSSMAQGCYGSWSRTARIVKEIAVIQLANSIDLSSAVPYYGINWHDLPKNLVYEFVVWHEVAHIIFGDQMAMIMARITCSNDDLNDFLALREAVEIRANRYAWGSVFSSPLPASLTKKWPDCLMALEKFHHFSLQRERPSIPLNSSQLVPWRHHKSGIPFVDQPEFPGAVKESAEHG